MRPTDGSVLSDDEFQQLQNLADRFAEARSRGGVEDWEPYLPPSGDRLRRHVLIELAKLDLEFTWREGGRVLVETYETLFPELTPLPIDLIAEEYGIRHRRGDSPAIEEHRQRFPDRAAEIESYLRSRPKESGPAVGASARATVRGEAQLPPSLQEIFPPGYTPVERIGKGNFGEVWRAEAPGGIAVAVKIISEPLDRDSAKKELAALELIKRLQHPKLLSTLAFWVIRNRLVIAMELADGTLRDRLKQWRARGRTGIPPDELIPYFRDAAEGLD
ncbi:MAG: protein kinase, partial [Gemmataceae bacterium]|nr:protein kinase [Gemmataceae bacterium]